MLRTRGGIPGLKTGLGSLALAGALGGLYGSGGMSVLRLGMRRFGFVDKMVPQAVEEWLSHRLGKEPPGEGLGHLALDQLLHLGYGLAWGGLAAPALFKARRRRGLWAGAALGAGVWALGSLALLPLLRIAKPAWKSSAAENATNIAAHLVFGLAVQLLAEEGARHEERGPSSDVERRRALVG